MPFLTARSLLYAPGRSDDEVPAALARYVAQCRKRRRAAADAGARALQRFASAGMPPLIAEKTLDYILYFSTVD